MVHPDHRPSWLWLVASSVLALVFAAVGCQESGSTTTPAGTGGKTGGGAGGSSSGAGGAIASGAGGAGIGGSGQAGASGAGGIQAGVGGAASGAGGTRVGTGGAASGAGGMAVLNCGTAVAAPGLLTDFSPALWSNMLGKWGTAGFTGAKYSYASDAMNGGDPSTATATVDTATDQQNLRFVAMVQPAGYAGFGLQFDQCANVSAYGAVTFTLAGTTGGCDLELQFQTFEQRPTDLTPPGGCDRATMSCFGFPSAKMLTTPADKTTPITVTVAFADVPSLDATTEAEIVGLQWQLTVPSPSDGGAQTACAADLRLDDVTFLPK